MLLIGKAESPGSSGRGALLCLSFHVPEHKSKQDPVLAFAPHFLAMKPLSYYERPLNLKKVVSGPKEVHPCV